MRKGGRARGGCGGSQPVGTGAQSVSFRGSLVRRELRVERKGWILLAAACLLLLNTVFELF